MPFKITRKKFGTLSNGKEVSLFTVSDGRMSVSATDYGCAITSVVLKGKDGAETDVALGYSTLDGYVAGDVFFGAFVGRFANRIGGASFSLDGEKYPLCKNDGQNSLHGGRDFWNKKVWKASVVQSKGKAGVKFSRVSPDGEQGFPGKMKVNVSYTIDGRGALSCEYTASTTKACPVNFTNHSYFNLAGFGTIDGHILKMDCDSILEVNSKLIPTGKFTSVSGTPYDFTSPKKIGKDISRAGVGYDNCFVTPLLKKNGARAAVPTGKAVLARVAEVTEPESGRSMTVDTNMEGVQLYTGNWIGGYVGKDGVEYKKHGGLCLETQCFPDSPNKPSFPSCVLRPGQTLRAVTVYSFKF